ncbi:non-hydrolyzing UDP-N-acetylglucosamine 2-epimerase [Roseovarius sp. E0-M6]|uniref:non-hydrolyzing UDP-N-acetylglucosamine 2-epimerase n=1 Tax=Roseovarius sp. E0-M6 TaxID=3127118 RepID=UPI00300F99BB
MKIVTIIGARPQFIKAAVVSRRILSRTDMEEVLVHTGQHYDDNMSDVFFKEMGIPAPKYHLGIGGVGHGAMTGRQLEAIETVLIDEKPDILIVYGDTNSTLAGALAAAKLNIPVAHIEAGLRGFDRRVPEEVNRVVTDHVSSWLFAPTEAAVEHLRQEGIDPENVVLSGDVMYDAALVYGAEAEQKSDILDRLNLVSGDFRFCTTHRQENTDNMSRLTGIFDALRALAEEKPMVLPLHPRTRKCLQAIGRFDEMTKGITLIDPIGFFDMICMLRGASVVMTDSGGVQKEAYFHGTPVVVMRTEQTEWTELVDLGWAHMVRPDNAKALVDVAHRIEGTAGDTSTQPYGNGHAADAILDNLFEGFKGSCR